jgi:NADH oxidase (H2O2-forming)
MHVVIIGNGIGGSAVAFNIRKYDKKCKVTIVSAENCPEYDPGSLPYYVGGDVPRTEVFNKKIEDYEKEDINLVLGKKIVNIDGNNKKVYTHDNQEIYYDKLVLAPGGNLIIPPIKGRDKKGVLYGKTLADADLLAEHNGKAAVVIGSGLIGIEMAEALKKRGFEVYLIELLDWVMPKLWDEKAGRLLGDALVRNGINVLTNEKVLSINGEDSVTGVVTDKRVIECDTVVIATGVVPAKELAVCAGAEVGRGIKVNENMMTSIKDIYACGDCVETKDMITGETSLYLLRHNALEQAEIVAKNCVGDNCTYSGAWNFARAHFFNTHAVSIGKTLASISDTSNAEIIEKEIGNNYYRLIIYDGKLAGAQAIGKFASQMGVLFGVIRRQEDLGNLKDNWKIVKQINSPYPWTHRVIGRYMNLSLMD